MEDKKKGLGKELLDMLVGGDGGKDIQWNLVYPKVGEFEEELWTSPIKGLSLNIKLKKTMGSKGQTVKIFYYGRGIGCRTITFYTGEPEIKDIYKDDTLKEALPREVAEKYYQKVEDIDRSIKDLVKGLGAQLAEAIRTAPEVKFTEYKGQTTEKKTTLTKGMLDNKLTEHCRSCPSKKHAKNYEHVVKTIPMGELEVSINQRASIYKRILDDFTKEGIPTGEYMTRCQACKSEFVGKLKSIMAKKRKMF